MKLEIRNTLCFALGLTVTLALFGCATQHPRMALIPMYVQVGNPPQPYKIPDGYSLVSEADGMVYANAILQAIQAQYGEAQKQKELEAMVQAELARRDLKLAEPSATPVQVPAAAEPPKPAAKPKPAPKPKPVAKVDPALKPAMDTILPATIPAPAAAEGK